MLRPEIGLIKSQGMQARQAAPAPTSGGEALMAADVQPPEGVVCGCQLTSPHQSTAHVASAKKTECSASSLGCPGEMTGHPVAPTHPKRPSQGADTQEGEL